MAEMLRLLLIPALIAVGILTSLRARTLADSIACGLGLFGILLALVLAVSGAFHGTPPLAEVHRWGAHGGVMMLWPGSFFTLGVALQQGKSHGMGRLTLRVMVVVFTLVVWLFSSFTGYAGPSHDPTLPRDAYHRFVVAHMIVLPAFSLLLFIVWSRIFWPQNAPREVHGVNSSTPTAPPTS